MLDFVWVILDHQKVQYCLSVCLSDVCRLSVTFVLPTQAIKIVGNISMPFGTLVIPDLSIQILRRLSQGNLSVGS